MKLMTGLLLGGLAVVDFKQKKIPVLPVAAMGVLLLLFRLWNGVELRELATGLLPGAGLLLFARLSREAVGTGDGLVLLALGMGYGAEEILVMLFVALCLAAGLSVVLLVSKRAGRKSEIPFLPFLFFGWMAGVLI